MTKAKGGPDFICVGPHKTGTGWLHDTLSYHREVYPTIEKEIRYFTYLNDRYRSNIPKKLDRARRVMKWLTYGRFKLFVKYPFRQGFRKNKELWLSFLRYEIRFLFFPSSLTWYRRLLDRPRGMLSGDTSPSYATLDISLIQHIKSEFPDIKIILFLREPVDRIWSHTKMNLAVKNLEPTEKNINHILRKYTNHNRYKRYPYYVLKDWIDVMGRDQVFIGHYEELIQDPVLLFKNICRFLEISDDLDNALRCQIEPYRIGHLYKSPPSFMSVEDVIRHRWKSSKLSISMPKYLMVQLVEDYKNQVEALHDYMPTDYSLSWLTMYEEALS